MSSTNKTIELKDIELQIPNHLQDRSPRLMDIFMIAGYENIYINEQIIEDITKVLDPKNKDNEQKKNISNIKEINEKGYGEYKCEVYPSILSSVTSDLESGEKEEDNYFYNIFDFQFYLEMCLCTTPTVYFVKDKQKIPEELIKSKDYIPTIITADAYNFCYSYLFYEEKTDNTGKITFYIPKLFMIVSKYQYYKVFHEICVDILNIFKSPKIQIPLEIQIYNIVNLTPAPSDCKLQLCLFPYQEFNLQKLNSINFYNNVKYLMIDRLSGYSQNQINLGLIFNYFSVETIIEIFLELCLFTPIAFFSTDAEKLYFIISIFNALKYPLLDEESVILNTFENFVNKELGKCNQDYYGILVNQIEYDMIKNKKEEIEGPNFYVLLEEEEKNLISTFKKKSFNPLNDINIDKLHNLLYKIIYEQEKFDCRIENIIKSSKKILIKINKEIKNKKLCKNYYESNAAENEINIRIRNAFYKFNLDISNFIYIYESENPSVDKRTFSVSSSKNLTLLPKQNVDNIGDNIRPNSSSNLLIVENVDDIFHSQIENVHYKDILTNFCKSEDKDKTSKNMRLPRKIFASFLADLNSNPKETRDIDYYRIIDSIYYQKEPHKSINFDFLEFYKYYYHNLDKYFSEVINSKYVTCSSEVIEKETKHFYTYKKTELIQLDSQLIMKYLCVLEQMDADDDLKVIKDKMFKKEYLYVPRNRTKNLDILKEIEKYYIENNLLNHKEIIRLCILNYIILTIPKKQLVYFNKGENLIGEGKNSKKSFNNFVYDLFDCIPLFKNKYIEMFLSVAYRFFKNSNEQNHYFIQPYIDLYDCCVIKRKLFKSEDIFILYKTFKSLSKKILKGNTSEPVESKNKELLEYNSDKELFEFEEINLNDKNILNQVIDAKLDGKLIDSKINLKCIYEPKNVSCDAIYSVKKLYSMIKKIMKDFYVKLEIKDANSDTMKEIGINLLFYCYILRNDNDLPFDSSKYILLNLAN